MDKKLNTSHIGPLAIKTNSIIVYISKSIASRRRILLFFCVRYWWGCIWSTVHVGASQYKRQLDKLVQVQLAGGLEYVMYKEWLREPGLFSLKNRWYRGSLIAIFKYLTQGQRENRARLWRRHSERIRNNRHQSQQGKKEGRIAYRSCASPAVEIMQTWSGKGPEKLHLKLKLALLWAKVWIIDIMVFYQSKLICYSISDASCSNGIFEVN